MKTGQDIGELLLFQLFFAHYSRRTRKGRTCLATEGYYHHVAHHLIIGGQPYLHLGTGRKCLTYHTDAGHLNTGAIVHSFQHEVAVHVGGTALLGAFHLD